tara:strand:- start:860 stop:1009 length:150 start_codon:yes stop_codon:yes gene_type:complete
VLEYKANPPVAHMDIGHVAVAKQNFARLSGAVSTFQTGDNPQQCGLARA